MQSQMRKSSTRYLVTANITAAPATIRQIQTSRRWFRYSDIKSLLDDSKDFAELSNEVETAATCVRDSASLDCNSVTKSLTFSEESTDSFKIISSSLNISSSVL